MSDKTEPVRAFIAVKLPEFIKKDLKREFTAIKFGTRPQSCGHIIKQQDDLS